MGAIHFIWIGSLFLLLCIRGMLLTAYFFIKYKCVHIKDN